MNNKRPGTNRTAAREHRHNMSVVELDTVATAVVLVQFNDGTRTAPIVQVI